MRLWTASCLVLGLFAFALPSVAEENPGLRAFERGDLAAASNYFDPLAARGDQVAEAFVTYIMLRKAGGLAGDDHVDAEKLRALAGAGNITAKTLLAQSYSDGLGLGIDALSAIPLFTEAAAQGNPLAQNDLGILYARGVGVKADPRVGIRFLGSAWEDGQVSAATI